MTNSELLVFLVVPALFLLAAFFLRERSPLWISLVALGVAVAAGFAAMQPSAFVPERSVSPLGLSLFLFLPLLLVVLVLRGPIFKRKPYLIFLVGPPVYFAGLLLAGVLAINTGFVQP